MKARARIDWDVADQDEAIATVAEWALHEGAEVILMVEQEAATELPSMVLAPVNVVPQPVDADGSVTIEPDDPAAVPVNEPIEDDGEAE